MILTYYIGVFLKLLTALIPYELLDLSFSLGQSSLGNSKAMAFGAN